MKPCGRMALGYWWVSSCHPSLCSPCRVDKGLGMKIWGPCLLGHPYGWNGKMSHLLCRAVSLLACLTTWRRPQLVLLGTWGRAETPTKRMPDIIQLNLQPSRQPQLCRQDRKVVLELLVHNTSSDHAAWFSDQKDTAKPSGYVLRWV